MTKLEEALKRFREGWQKYRQNFVLIFYTPSRVDHDNPLVMKGEQILSAIRLPLAAGVDTEFTNNGIVKFYEAQIPEEAANEFKECCIAAGAALPSFYLEFTEPFVENNFLAGTVGPEASFLALLAYSNQFVMYPDKNDLSRYNEQHVLQRPWEKCIILLEDIIKREREINSDRTQGEEQVGRTVDTTGSARKRGRKKADYETVMREERIVHDWNQARESGVRKIDFAKQQKMKFTDFENLLDRVAARKRHARK